MKLVEEKSIIRDAIAEAFGISENRQDTARKAVLIADRDGVNVASAPYLHDIFCEALDQYFD